MLTCFELKGRSEIRHQSMSTSCESVSLSELLCCGVYFPSDSITTLASLSLLCCCCAVSSAVLIALFMLCC